MRHRQIEVGDVVQNARGWQGKVLQVSQSKRFGRQVLVLYASQRQWEDYSQLELMTKNAILLTDDTGKIFGAIDCDTVLEKYYNAIARSGDGDLDLIKDHTALTQADRADDGVNVRFETTISTRWPKICQYARLDDAGNIDPGSLGGWFIPGDICFFNFTAALRFLENYRG